MKQKHSLILALLITLLIAGNVYVFSLLEKPNTRTVLITEVIDGDTLELEGGTRIRLLNINTPEKNEFGYEQAKEFLAFYENKTVEIEEFGADKYERTLAKIFFQGVYINLEIVKQGLATKFLVQDSELKEFNDAEKLAIQNEKGIWKKSQYFDCFAAGISPEKEVISLQNHCGELNIANWAVKDESKKEYKFESISLGKINLHSSIGEDNETDLFWQNEQNVWNNDRDTFYLFDSDEKIVYSESYGY